MQSNRHPSVQILSRHSWWNKRTSLEKRLLLLFGVIAVAGIILLIIRIASVTPSSHNSQDEVCITEKCILSASNLLQSMDPHKDPCEDFYGYACGNWKKKHPIPDTANIHHWLREKTHLIHLNVRNFLRQNHSVEYTAWVKAKKLYESCLDTETLDSLKLKPVFELLKIIGLQEMPPLPGSPTSSPGQNKPELNWLAIAAKAKKFFSIDLLIGFSLQPFFKPDVNIIALGPAREKSFLPGSLNSEENVEELPALLAAETKEKEKNKTNGGKITQTSAYVEYRRDVLGYVYNKTADQVLTPAHLIFHLEYSILKSLNSTVPDIHLDDFKNMQQIINGTQNMTTFEKEDMIHISIDTLQNITNIWSNGSSVANWTEYFSILYEDINGVNITGDHMVLVLYPRYLKSLLNIMSTTPRETIEMLMWWKVMEAVASHTTTQMRLFNEKFTKLTTGIEVTNSRSITCTKVVMHTMSLAVVSFFANNDFISSTKNAMNELYLNIKEAFTSIINSSTWLDGKTKKTILEKVEGIVINTAYPQWLLSRDKLDEYYEGVEINDGQFLLDAANISRWKMEKDLASLATGPLSDEYFINPTLINAYYNTFRHSITFLAGYLQFPFYDLGHDALNYGITGFTAGHELHHAFDTKGILFKNGELGLWWNLTFIQEYLNRRQCFTQQYSKYGWDDLKVNGNLTVNEDMADYGGLLTSLLAYQKILKEKGSELLLPGFTNHTSEQLFFLSFANFFCNDITDNGKKFSLYDVHTPQEFRLIGSVINSKEFSRIWNCPNGTNMNPTEQKCKLW